MTRETFTLLKGERYQITGSNVARGQIWYIRNGFENVRGPCIRANTVITLGPYLHDVSIAIDTETPSISLARVPALGPVPSLIYDLYGEGAPVAGVAASKLINPTGDDNAILFTANAAGVEGNDITVEYRAQEEAEAQLSVLTQGFDIVVLLEMDDSEPPEIVSTAADIISALDGHSLVTAAASDADEDATGSVGVVTAVAKTALASGVDATGAHIAEIGTRYTDTETGTVYVNQGTFAAPVWAEISVES